MSQPKRWNKRLPEISYGMEESETGEYVLYSDYAALAAEKEALVQQGIRDHGDWRSKLNFLEADYKAKIARLTAENERLRKAGDDLERDLFLRMNLNAPLPSSIAEWNAAKEGGAK